MPYRRRSGGVCPGPLCDRGLNRIPDTVSDEQALFVGDLLATGFWAARISEITEEDTVLVIGAGPTGLCTLLCVMLKRPKRVIVCENSPERARFVKEHYPRRAGDRLGRVPGFRASPQRPWRGRLRCWKWLEEPIRSGWRGSVHVPMPSSRLSRFMTDCSCCLCRKCTEKPDLQDGRGGWLRLCRDSPSSRGG